MCFRSRPFAPRFAKPPSCSAKRCTEPADTVTVYRTGRPDAKMVGAPQRTARARRLQATPSCTRPATSTAPIVENTSHDAEAKVVDRRVGLPGGVAVAARPAVAQAREPYPGLDAYIAKAVQTWKIPGLRRHRPQRFRALHQRLRRSRLGQHDSGQRTDAVRDRVELQGVHGDARRDARRATARCAGTNASRRICPTSGCTIPSPTKASRFATRCRIAAASRAVSSSGSAPASRATRCCTAFGSSSRNRRSDRSGRIRT